MIFLCAMKILSRYSKDSAVARVSIDCADEGRIHTTLYGSSSTAVLFAVVEIFGLKVYLTYMQTPPPRPASHESLEC